VAAVVGRKENKKNMTKNPFQMKSTSSLPFHSHFSHFLGEERKVRKFTLEWSNRILSTPTDIASRANAESKWD
jgi:hypothetical protein